MARLPVPASSPSPDPVPRPKRRRTVLIVLAGLLLGGVAALDALLSDQAAQEHARLEQTERKASAAREAWQAAAQQVRADRFALLTAYAPPGSPFRMIGFRRSTSGARPVPVNRATLLLRNAPALAAFRNALSSPYRDAPDKTAPDPFGVRFSVRATSNYLPLACLLVLDGDEKQDKGDLAGAANAYLDALQMGQTLQRGGAVSALSTGVAYQKNGQEKLWKLLPKLDAKTARAAARRLQNLCADTDAHASFTDALREEKARGEAGLRQTFHDPKQLQRVQLFANAIRQMQQRSRGGGRGFVSAFSSSASTPAPPVSFWGRVTQKWEEWRMVREFDASINEQIALSQLPYQSQQQAQHAQTATRQGQALYVTASANGSSFSSFGGGSGVFSSFYTSYGSPGMIRSAQDEWTNNEAENRLLMTALAIQAFRADHANRDPAALSDLVPTYLSRVPDDPYALPVAPLCWKPAAQTSSPVTSGVLYSVGPDGKDDGGTVPQGSIRQLGMGRGFYPFASVRRAVGKGDLVAGKTTP